MAPKSDYALDANSVSGHALELLARKVAGQPGMLHLDVGCGDGHMAEPLTSLLGLHYVGIDRDNQALRSLTERGFETHGLAFSDEGQIYEGLRHIVGERAVGSITVLDTIERLTNADALLRAVSQLARLHNCYVVVSSANVAHGDVGRKLAFGLWDYTEGGILDRGHVRLFDNRGLGTTLAAAGLHEIDRHDVQTGQSEQNFPASHPALASGTELHALLHQLRLGADPFTYVSRFVRLCVPGPAVLATIDPAREGEGAPARPFLSIIMRTQGTRLHTFIEALTCLSAQTDPDFELLVLGHKLDRERQLDVERVIADTADRLRQQIRYIAVDTGNRTHPLNVGFEEARGEYIAILDDDDAPLAHWVETFKKLARQTPGKVLRCACVRQNVRNVDIRGQRSLRAEGGFERYPASFDFLAHLRGNQSPPIGLAFPRGPFHSFGIRFDESLTTTEDWDFLMRTAAVVGVASAGEVTGIYRWWTKDESSRTDHPQSEWDSNYQRILTKLDQAHIVLPRGAVPRIRYLVDFCETQSRGGGDGLPPDVQRELDRLRLIEQSTSWRIMALPRRLVSRIRRQIRFRVIRR
ncbi:hypothetical protein GCM10010994_53220 [Chelatococcus reniformis]|uniref:Glycosyltransferase 2-like domain-containing protein n=1 Tax=Chelatococcus reniformis TaxID=1494448 RepID=A0A916UVF3_9HYPH|nr:hypothetical protein GCM10010994_53220 [Chelatococcus reniformis]